MQSSLPSRATAYRLAREALLNAASLVEDAELLLANRRWPRAFALGVLALEEIGKMLLTGGAATTEAWDAKEFWLDFRHHATKLGSAKALLAVLATDVSPATLTAIDQAMREAADGHQRKMCGLYVDLADDGTVQRPNDVTEAECRSVLGGAHALLDLLLPAWTSDAFDQKTTELLTDHAEPFQVAVDLAVEAARVTPEETLRLVRGFLLGEQPTLDTDSAPTEQSNSVSSPSDG
jgi:AbiV family abortive infection protein